MRNFLVVALSGLTACAARPTRPAYPVEYTCGAYSMTRAGDVVTTSAHDVGGRLSWRDSAGDHFVSWPLSPTDRQAFEFIVPDDPMQDAVQRTFDTANGSSTADWRLTSKQVCTANGGYNDVLARYIRGDTLEDLTRDFDLESRDEARVRIRKALVSVQRRYYHDH